MNKRYRVEFFMEEGGYVIVSASSEEKARDMVLTTLQEYGVEALSDPDVTHRDMMTMNVETLA